jgi:PIN domain nuclease of toxin-antitoxin system
MRLLLDTQILLWAISKPGQLRKDARAAIEDPANDVMFSAASIWEIAIKASLKRANFRVSAEEIATAGIETGFMELPIRSVAAAYITKLPAHYRDPFDRLLIAQAITEPAVLYTADAQLEIYSKLVHRI